MLWQYGAGIQAGMTTIHQLNVSTSNYSFVVNAGIQAVGFGTPLYLRCVKPVAFFT